MGQSYSDLFRQLYIDRRMAEKKLPQQMAAMGYTGGLTESSALGLQTDYTEALRQGEQQRVSSMADLDQAITDTELQGDISIADLAAQNAKDKLTTYASLVEALQAQSNDDRQYEYSKLLNQMEQDNLDYSKKLAAAQYLFENSGDASGLRQLGYTDSQIAALQKQWTAAQNASGGTAKVAEYKPRLTYAQVIEQINGGNLTSQVLSDYEYYMGEPLVQKPEETESSGYRSVSNYVSRIADTTNGTQKAFNYIQNAYLNGTITEAEARTLLRNYGLL